MPSPVDLSVSFGPLTLQNPVVASAGTFAYGLEFEEFFDLSLLGALITKTLTLEPRPGNPGPRVAETPAGMINAVGLANIGIDAFLKDTWPLLRNKKVPVIISLSGFSEAEFVALAKRVQGIGAAGMELNLSCPNVVQHGSGAFSFAQSPEQTRSVVRAVKGASQLPVLAKLSPAVTDIPAMARAAEEGGADAVTLINTLPAMLLDVDTEQPVMGHGTGGLSGPAIRPLAVRCIWEAYRSVRIPILGVGGVVSGRDALELILAGAAAVGVGTATFWNPRAPKIILEELTRLIAKKGVALRELVGRANRAAQASSSARPKPH